MAQDAETTASPELAADAPAPATATAEPATSETVQDAAETKFDLAYVKQLRGEAAKYRKDASEARTKLSEYEESQKSELERAIGKLEKAEKARDEAEAQLTRYEVATQKAIPAKLVPLLTASTREELEAQADLLLEVAPTSFDGGARQTAPQAKTPEQAHNDALLEVLGVAKQL